jgi:glycosyltransferase involved in cell wall biosynthesis
MMTKTAEPVPPVTVITIAYNASRYLPDAIASTQAQTDPDFEYLIVDDASTDNTRGIADAAAAEDPRIRVLSNERNSGIAFSRNHGIREARGRYILWLNADDLSVAARLEKQRKFLDEHPDVVYVGGYMRIFSDSRGTIGIRRYPTEDADIRRMFHRFLPVTETGGMVRRDALAKIGQYDLTVSPGDDLDITFRLARVGKLANLPEVTVDYRISDDMTSIAKMRDMYRSTVEIRRRYVDDFPPTVGDRLVGFAQRLAMLLPAKMKMKLVTHIRDTPPGAKVSRMNRLSTRGNID